MSIPSLPNGKMASDLDSGQKEEWEVRQWGQCELTLEACCEDTENGTVAGMLSHSLNQAARMPRRAHCLAQNERVAILSVIFPTPSLSYVCSKFTFS